LIYEIIVEELETSVKSLKKLIIQFLSLCVIFKFIPIKFQLFLSKQTETK